MSYFTDQNETKEDNIKINFENFQTQKWMWQTVRTEKVHEKNGAICLVFIFFSLVIVLKLSKKVHFLKFSVDFNKKFNCNKAIYLYAFERSRYALSENGIVLWISAEHPSFYILFSISWAVAEVPINHIIFCKSVMRTSRCIYSQVPNKRRGGWGVSE